ncbi:MAG: AI-2E family transporter [Acidobacteriota bacterium]
MKEVERQNRVHWPKLLPYIVTTIVILLLGYFLIETFHRIADVVQPVFIPLLISLALAYLLEPLVDWFVAKKFSRNSATLLTLLVAGLLLVLMLIFLVPSFWSQLSDMIAKLPTTTRSAADWIQVKLAYLQERNPALYERISKGINEYLNNPTELTEPIVNFIKRTLGQLGTITASVLNLILIPLFVYYILVDFRRLGNALYQIVPPRHRTTVTDLFRQIDSVLRSFVRGQLLVCSAMSLLYVIGFLILGVPMGFTLGVLSGFGHLIPYFGTASAAILVIAFTALDSPEWWRLLAVIVMYPLVQTTEGFLLTPRILGDKLELHPFVILVGIIVGHHLFGILGIMLAAPVMACTKVLLIFLYKRYLTSNFYLRPTSQSNLLSIAEPAPEQTQQMIDAPATNTPSLVD